MSGCWGILARGWVAILINSYTVKVCQLLAKVEVGRPNFSGPHFAFYTLD
jgi:hypothetical protein